MKNFLKLIGCILLLIITLIIVLLLSPFELLNNLIGFFFITFNKGLNVTFELLKSKVVFLYKKYNEIKEDLFYINQ
jgi:hypothetical protein